MQVSNVNIPLSTCAPLGFPTPQSALESAPGRMMMSPAKVRIKRRRSPKGRPLPWDGRELGGRLFAGRGRGAATDGHGSDGGQHGYGHGILLPVGSGTSPAGPCRATHTGWPVVQRTNGMTLTAGKSYLAGSRITLRKDSGNLAKPRPMLGTYRGEAALWGRYPWMQVIRKSDSFLGCVGAAVVQPGPAVGVRKSRRGRLLRLRWRCWEVRQRRCRPSTAVRSVGRIYF